MRLYGGINGWSAKGQREKCSTALYIYRLNTDTHSLRDSPRWEFSDEVVAHVQNFQFLCFAQPVWQRLHMVPAGGEWVIVMVDCVQFVKQGI